MIHFHVRDEPVEGRHNRGVRRYGFLTGYAVWGENGFHDDDGNIVDPPENADQIIDAHLRSYGLTREEVFAPQDYETQGWYRKWNSKNREWSTHISGLTLAEARRCYSWFSRSCESNDPGDRTVPTKARIVNSLTGEVMDPPVLVQAERIPGTRIKTIPCTQDEFRVSTRESYYLNKSPRRGGGYTYTSGRDYVIGYEMPDGSFRIRPDAWKPPPRQWKKIHVDE